MGLNTAWRPERMLADPLPTSSTRANRHGHSLIVICATATLVAENMGATYNWTTVVVPTGVLWVHPGKVRDTLVQWTAPTAGIYSYSGEFELLDIHPTGVIGEVFAGGTLQRDVDGAWREGIDNDSGSREAKSGEAEQHHGPCRGFGYRRRHSRSQPRRGGGDRCHQPRRVGAKIPIVIYSVSPALKVSDSWAMTFAPESSSS